jgi:hypothetical protein
VVQELRGVAQVQPPGLLEPRGGLRPAAEADEVLRGVDAHGPAERAAHADLGGERLALLHHRQRAGEAPAQAQDLPQVRRDPQAVLRPPERADDALGGAHVRLARLGIAEEGERRAERDPA